MTYTAEQAESFLRNQGYDRKDVRAAIDSLIDAGLEIGDQPDYGWLLTDAEIGVLRDQLDGK